MNLDQKTPRLYIDAPLETDRELTLPGEQSHYLKNVLRMKPGESLRLFNGRDGEYVGVIATLEKNRADIRITEQIKPQTPPRPEKHLIFSPIKKHRMDFLIEKSVELGVTHLHPALMQRTTLRKINEERIHAQIIEAAEQCERLDIPALAPLWPLDKIIAAWAGPEILWAIERVDAPHIKSFENRNAFLIGPEGGFAPEEIMMLERQKKIRAASLGPDILRAETAALYCLV